MTRVIQLTNDGSSTISIPEKGITYHNTSGAIGESLHVFIDAGLQYLIQSQSLQQIHIFEMGFGTGLNALLTWQFAQQQELSINYTSVESNPILPQEISLLNYGQQLQMTDAFTQLHQCGWEIPIILDKNFTLTKTKQSLLNYDDNQQYNIIYYDAFAPDDQPELWTNDVFEKLYNMLLPDGILVTYCSKGDVKRTMKAVGFKVERLKGFADKWHMLRGRK